METGAPGFALGEYGAARFLMRAFWFTSKNTIPRRFWMFHSVVTSRGWARTSSPATVVDSPTTSDVRATTLTAIYRALYQISSGPSKTVAGLLQQERRTLAFAGTGESLPAEEEAALRTAVTPYLAATDEGTQVVVLFGDRIAVALGYDARGIPERGELRLAASEAVRERDPIASLLG